MVKRGSEATGFLVLYVYNTGALQLIVYILFCAGREYLFGFPRYPADEKLFLCIERLL